jgi:glycosyltransferase involved in cell wall biosynthesis
MKTPVIIPVSCIGSCYSGSSPAKLKASILSLLTSSVKPAEIILVVDGPVDKSLSDAIASLSAIDCLTILPISVNQGLGNALSTALSFSKYDYIARYDTDDISVPGRLFVQYEFMNTHSHIDCCGSHVYEFPDQSQFSNFIYATPKFVPISPLLLKLFIWIKNPINHPTVMFKKQAIRAVGGYRSVLFFEDYDLWLRLHFAGYSFANLDSFLVFMNRDSALSRRSGFYYFSAEIRFACKVLVDSSIPIYCSLPLFILFVARAFLRIISFGLISQFVPWRKSGRQIYPDVITLSYINRFFC